MRTTIRLEEVLLKEAKREAARRGTTLTALIEQGLRLALRRPQPRHSGSIIRLPECRARGGTLPGVDLNDSAATLDRLEGRD